MKKKLLLSSFFMILILFLLNVKVEAATLEKTTVDIYARSEAYSYITIPSNYAQSYTL